LTPESPTAELDFSRDPFAPRRLYCTTYTRHFYADPEYFLVGLDMEIRYHYKSGPSVWFKFGADIHNQSLYSLDDDSGIFRRSISLPFGTRAAGARLDFNKEVPSGSYITSWKVTGRFRPASAPRATLVVKTPEDWKFRVRIDGKFYGTRFRNTAKRLVEGSHTIRNVPAGPHLVTFEPHVWGPNRAIHDKFDFKPGEEVEVKLSADVDFRRRGEIGGLGSIEHYRKKRISTPYDVYRMGANLGDPIGRTFGDVRFYSDRDGQWIVVWNLRRDLYMAVSGDKGQTWSPTVKLPPPVNSAHDERFPVVTQDSSGRYVLMFSSDRGNSRIYTAYVCWSEDLKNFSAPVKVSPEPSKPIRVLQRRDGTYLAYVVGYSRRWIPGVLYSRTDRFVTGWYVCTSMDMVHWSHPYELPRPSGSILTRSPDFVRVGQKYRMLYLRQDLSEGVQRRDAWMQSSEDGVHFSEASSIFGSLRGATTPNLACQQQRDRLFAVIGPGLRGCVLEYVDGTWKDISPFYSISDLRYGDVAVGEKGLYYFSIPINLDADRQLSNETESYAGDRSPWDLFGRPVFMCRYEYAKPRITATDAEAKTRPVVSQKVSRSLDSAQPIERLPSANATADFGENDVERFVRSLSNGNARERLTAVSNLGRIGPPAHASVEELLEAALSDPNVSVRLFSVAALARMGAVEVPALTEIVNQQEGPIRLAALSALGELGPKSLPAVEAIVRLLPASDADTRFVAIHTLGKIGPQAGQALADLARVFEDRDVSIRARTIEAMVRIDVGSRSTQGVLEKAIKDADSKIRRQAVMSLEQVGAAAVPLLLEAMKDPDFSVRRTAAAALGRIGPDARAAIGVLTEALTDQNVRGYAKIALQRIQNDPR